MAKRTAMPYRAMPRARVAVLTLVLGWGVAGRVAWADEPRVAVASADAKQAARALVAEGESRFARRDYPGALASYSEAYRLVHVPTVGLAVAQTQVALGLLLDAQVTALEIVALPVQAGEPKVFAEARVSAAELERSLRQRIPSVLVEVSPPGASPRFQVDGREAPSVGETSLKLNPGPHRLSVDAPGHSPVEQAFKLTEGEARRLRVMLAPTAVAAPEAALSPPAVIAPAASEPASPPREEVARERSLSGAEVRGVVALSIAGAGVLVGSTTGILAFTSKPDCPGSVCPLGSQQAIDESKRFGNIANVSFAVAVVAAGYGLWELLANGKPTTGVARPLELGLVPGTGEGAQLQWSGAF
jgi:hypothetical protein